jgi:hypothetical protein
MQNQQNTFWAVSLLAIAIILSLCGCGGGGTPPVKNPNGGTTADPVNYVPGAGTVFVQLSQTGDDTDVTGKVVSPLLEKALKNAGINVVPSNKEAELVVHGTVTLRHEDANRRLGLDHHKYAAQASWRIIRANGYRSLVSQQASAKGDGIGKAEAIKKTLTNLAAKVSAEAIPALKRELAAR